MECLLASFAVKARLDLDRFEQINSKNQADLRRVVEARKAAAVERSPSTKQTLRHQAARRRKVLEHRAGKIKPAASPAPFVLDTPFMISTTPGVFVDNIITEPWNSSAKIRARNGGDTSGLDQVTFSYLWVNPEDTFAVIDVNGFIGANGYCAVGSDGGLFASPRGSSLAIFANLAVLEGSSSVPATSPFQPIIPPLATNTSGTIGGASESRNVLEGYTLELDQLLVSPGESVVIQVVFNLGYFTSQGYADFDFSSGDFDVFSAFAAVTIISG
jgi:hypothetical protein